MSRFSERMRTTTRVATVVLVLGGMLWTTAGCEQVDGRNRVRKANTLFRETRFIDAAAEYHVALNVVDDPVIHYNLGLAYQKIFRPAFDVPILLGMKGDHVCTDIPGTQLVEAGACVKEGDRRFSECGAAKSEPIQKRITELTQLVAQLTERVAIQKKQVEQLVAAQPPASPEQPAPKPDQPKSEPKVGSEDAKDAKDAKQKAEQLKLLNDAQAKLESDEAKNTELQSELRDKQDELSKYTCASSFQCIEGSFCSLRAPEIAEAAAQHFKRWIAAQPSDDVIKTMRAEALKALEAAKASGNQALISTTQKEFDDLDTKDQTRKIMTQLWNDSDQYAKAIDYWEGLLKDRPGDTVIMGVLAGINRSAGNWRKSIDWYGRVAETTTDPGSKVASYQSIAYAAWGKLNSRSLIGSDSVELADRGIFALQRASEIQPKNRSLFSLQGALYNFRSTAHGASWAGAIDRASQQDLKSIVDVLTAEAKKAQGQAPPAPPAPPAPGSPSGKTGG
jgi:tetratricopeptide (TPR) repeat protein